MELPAQVIFLHKRYLEQVLDEHCVFGALPGASPKGFPWMGQPELETCDCSTEKEFKRSPSTYSGRQGTSTDPPEQGKECSVCSRRLRHPWVVAHPMGRVCSVPVRCQGQWIWSNPPTPKQGFPVPSGTLDPRHSNQTRSSACYKSLKEFSASQFPKHISPINTSSLRTGTSSRNSKRIPFHISQTLAPHTA